jgi:type IV secretion system protein VirB1
MMDLSTLMHQCAPSVAPVVLKALIRAESGFDPLALHINGKARLRYAPRSAGQAATWSSWLIERGYSIDLGLMQINSRNLAALNLTPEGAFDPCQNVRAGAALLKAQYARAKQAGSTDSKALLQAISAYNTGNFQGGFSNGYVAKVMMNNAEARELLTLDMTCLLTHCASSGSSTHRPAPAYTADTAIGGFGVSIVQP